MIRMKLFLGGDSWRLIGCRAPASLSGSPYMVARMWGIVIAGKCLKHFRSAWTLNVANTISIAAP